VRCWDVIGYVAVRITLPLGWGIDVGEELRLNSTYRLYPTSGVVVSSNSHLGGLGFASLHGNQIS